MKSNTDINTATASSPRFALAARALIPFVAVTVCGTLLTAVAGLFTYANAIDVGSRDGRFIAVMAVGVSLTLIAAYIAARRSLAVDPDQQMASAYGLLRKYRSETVHNGPDTQSGHYSIGEQYLRELLGRRGA